MDIKKIGIVGSGVIGASWAAFYLAKGYDVIVTDPAEQAETQLRQCVDEYWPTLESELVVGASKDRLAFNHDIAKALAGCHFIQENGPERLDIKHDIIASIEMVVDKDVIIATSSSGIIISDIQQSAKHPHRILLGHPFNPPHLIPLVEVVGGKLTSEEAIEQAIQFYDSLGKKPIRLRKEVRGHIANRLQAAILREAIYLLEEGVASARDIDTAVSHGPGLRWALHGPLLTMDLAGGSKGIEHALDHLGPAIEYWWQDLGTLEHISEEAKAGIVEGVTSGYRDIDRNQMLTQRDRVLLTLLKAKASSNQLP